MAGEREGFSLVELIIVIAIMAILIGVIALAVIPNIQRSRESKDLTTLDNILSAANIAIANQQITTTGDVTKEYKSGETDPVIKAVYDEIGDASIGSSAAGTGKIYVTYNTKDSSAAKIIVKIADSASGDAKPCNYTTKEDGTTKQVFEVSNGVSS